MSVDDIAFTLMCVVLISPVWLWIGKVTFYKVSEWNGMGGSPTVLGLLLMPILFPFILLIRMVKLLISLAG